MVIISWTTERERVSLAAGRRQMGQVSLEALRENRQGLRQLKGLVKLRKETGIP